MQIILTLNNSIDEIEANKIATNIKLEHPVCVKAEIRDSPRDLIEVLEELNKRLQH